MPVRTPLVLKSAAVVNAVGLVVGLICYQSGMLFPAPAVTQEELNAVVNARRANVLQFSFNSEDSQSDVSTAGGVGEQTPEFDNIMVIGFDSQPEGLEIIRTTTGDSIVVGVPIVGFPNFDQMRRVPGPASPELLLNDSMNLLMSSSKSGVIVPRTPDEKQRVIDRYISNATSSFRSLDLDHDDRLTERELDYRYWGHLKQQGAISDDAIDFEGFLKNYVKYKFEYDRLHRH